MVKPKYNNPALELTQRAYLDPNDTKFKAMIDTMWDHFKKDKNSEFKFCANCMFVAETKAGGRLHKDCKDVYTSKQLSSK